MAVGNLDWTDVISILAVGVFFILAVGFFVLFLSQVCGRIRGGRLGRKMKHRKEEKKEDFPEDFVSAVDAAYQERGSIRGMIEELLNRYPVGEIHSSLEAARNYLLYSRYKDYETTLYHYLPNNTEELKELYAKIILKEIGKRMRLPMKEQEKTK